MGVDETKLEALCLALSIFQEKGELTGERFQEFLREAREAAQGDPDVLRALVVLEGVFLFNAESKSEERAALRQDET